jgi:hypothetical protein
LKTLIVYSVFVAIPPGKSLTPYHSSSEMFTFKMPCSASSRVLMLDLRKYDDIEPVEPPPSRGVFSQVHMTPDRSQSTSLTTPSDYGRSIPSSASVASSHIGGTSPKKRRSSIAEEKTSAKQSSRGVKGAIVKEIVDT